MQILIIEPFFAGSHRLWAEGFKAASSHIISILSLKGAHWKWRMHGAAVTLARQFLEQELRPDLILATDMLDLATFLGLTRNATANIPVAIYFHENQLTYPWSDRDTDIVQKRDNHYAFINFTSTLAADLVLFNSNYHKNSFLTELPTFLKQFPDHNELESVNVIGSKSYVLSLGESYAKAPPIFKQAKQKLANHILHWGFCANRNEYAQWLHRSDVLPVTSGQDFFGGSVVEAMHCNVVPLLPNRLAFPEHIPADLQT